MRRYWDNRKTKCTNLRPEQGASTTSPRNRHGKSTGDRPRNTLIRIEFTHALANLSYKLLRDYALDVIARWQAVQKVLCFGFVEERNL